MAQKNPLRLCASAPLRFPLLLRLGRFGIRRFYRSRQSNIRVGTAIEFSPAPMLPCSPTPSLLRFVEAFASFEFLVFSFHPSQFARR